MKSAMGVAVPLNKMEFVAATLMTPVRSAHQGSAEALTHTATADARISMAKEKPAIEEVVAYAQKNVEIYIRDKASDLPREQKDEIRQDAFLRVVKAYENLDPEQGWKRFVQMHCAGAVLDYTRWGNGFQETNKSLREPDANDEQAFGSDTQSQTNVSDSVKAEEEDAEPENEAQPRKSWRLRYRVTHVSEDDTTLDVEQVAGFYGVFAKMPSIDKRVRPRWELISRMANVDDDVHLIAKLLLGFTQTELGPMFGVSRERIGQRMRAFLERLDDPEHIHSRWVKQIIFAFGLSEVYGEPDVDQEIGWDQEPIDLGSLAVIEKRSIQTSLVLSGAGESMMLGRSKCSVCGSRRCRHDESADFSDPREQVQALPEQVQLSIFGFIGGGA